MREILFRGKRLDNGEWIEGAFSPKDCDMPFGPMVDKPSIIKLDDPCSGFWFEVDLTTVGQYTGLKDKNGKRIFEGDVFQYGFDEVAAVAVVKFGEFGFGSQFDMNQVGFYAEWNPRAMYYRTDLGFWVKQRDIEIIGNIYDNPELIGGGEDG